nr:reverse transcriptase domain-containing protein [Tanacetum cinerariifolium]
MGKLPIFGPIASIPFRATDFRLRHHMIQQVQNTCQFHGLSSDDANRHIDKFLEITQHMKQNGVSDDAPRLYLFTYSLTHHATAWYDRLPRNSIHTFNDMMKKFLSKFVPPLMVTKLRNEITKFRQDPNESLFEAWERYNLSIDRYPKVAPKPKPTPLIPYPSRLNDQKLREKANNQMMKLLRIFQRLHFDISFVDALLHMLKFASAFKGLLSNKEKLFELANNQLNENCSAVLLKNSTSGNPTPSDPIIATSFPSFTPFEGTDFTLEEIETFLRTPEELSTLDDDFDSEGDIALIEKLLNEDLTLNIPPMKNEYLKRLQAGSPTSKKGEFEDSRGDQKGGGMTIVENEDNELIPTRLVTGWRVCIDYRKLNDATRKDHFPLPFMDQMLERLTGNEYYCFLDGFLGYFYIPIDLSMMAIFYDMIEETMEEKCHFMVKEGIVLGLKISMSGIKVNRAKVDVINKLPHPTFVKGFNILKKKLAEASILVVLDWNLPFEIICDASDFAVGAVLRQRKTKYFQPIHNASKTMIDAQAHYTTTEKELLAVVFAFEKFWPYLVLSKTIVYTDHSTLTYILAKQDAKPRFLWWILLL